jgi:transposase InsO family protein
LPVRSAAHTRVRLAQAIRRYGKPRILRTDNEAVFTSRTFRLGLLLLGIRHQRIDAHCPWQNGRMERFFGTLKRKLDRLSVAMSPVRTRRLSSASSAAKQAVETANQTRATRVARMKSRKSEPSA